VLLKRLIGSDEISDAPKTTIPGRDWKLIPERERSIQKVLTE
jgi:hypothetical protein